MQTYNWRHSPTPHAKFWASATATATATSTAGWTPADVTTAFWYDASDNATVLNAGLTAASNGQGVARWNDKSGNSRNLTQATTATQALYNTNALNSLAGLTFDVTDDYMSSTGFTLAQPFLVMCVFKGTSGFYSIYFGDNSGDAARPLLMTRNEFSPTNALAVFANSSINTGATVRSTGNAFYGLYNGASSAGAITGSTERTGSLGTAGVTAGIICGSTVGGDSNTINGNLCELFCITGNSGTDKDNAKAYVAAKWDITW